MDTTSMVEQEEIWKPILEFMGTYEVSNAGRVRRVSPGSGTFVGKILKPALTGGGYLNLVLYRGRYRRTRRVHRLVTEAFLGPRPYLQVVNHLDGVKSNNVLSNLEYVTPTENIIHAIKNGHKPTKLDAEKVKQIRSLYAAGSITQRQLGQMFGVSQPTIKVILNRKIWTWVEDDKQNSLDNHDTAA